MPKCNPRCPIVKQQLRKLATESPWVFKDLATRSDLKVATLIGTADERTISATVTAKREEDLRGSAGTYDPSDPRYKAALERRIRTSGTQWDGTKEGYDPLVKTDVSKILAQGKVDRASGIDTIRGMDRSDRASGIDAIDGMDRTDRASGVDTSGGMDRTDRASGIDATDGTGRTDRGSSASKLDAAKKMDKETLKRELTDKSTEFAALRNECEQSCPRRISRKSRLRKLEEAQCIIDTYILNKGARYFEDICTCSLSCVLRALRRDPFVTSTLASITLFSLGLKLCSELDAWYLPVRFS